MSRAVSSALAGTGSALLPCFSTALLRGCDLGVTSDGITSDTIEQITSRKQMCTRCERCFYTRTARNPLNEIDYMLPG